MGWNESVRGMPLRWVASAHKILQWTRQKKRFGFASLWPRPRWDPLAWAGAVTSCKTSESAEINKEKRRVQPQPWGSEREQLSCGRDGKTSSVSQQHWKPESTAIPVHWNLLDWEKPKDPDGNGESCHFNLPCWVSSGSNVALLGLPSD